MFPSYCKFFTYSQNCYGSSSLLFEIINFLNLIHYYSSLSFHILHLYRNAPNSKNFLRSMEDKIQLLGSNSHHLLRASCAVLGLDGTRGLLHIQEFYQVVVKSFVV